MNNITIVNKGKVVLNANNPVRALRERKNNEDAVDSYIPKKLKKKNQNQVYQRKLWETSPS